MPIRSVKDLVQGRIERDPAFAAQLLREGRTEPDSLAEAILEMADDMHRAGIMDAETRAAIVKRHSS